MSNPNDSIPYGFCHCGCGEQTNIAKTTHPRQGHVRGEPYRYIRGHHSRITSPEWIEEDHGYKTPCHIWQRSLKDLSYGKKWVDGNLKYAHVIAYEDKYGPVPDGLVLDHLCRITTCRNPDHVEPVTQAVNVQRSRMAKLTWDDVAEIRSLKGVLSNRQMARRFGVSCSRISDILNGKTWRAVA